MAAQTQTPATTGDVIPFQQPRPPARREGFTFNEIERIACAIAKGGLFGSNNLDAVLTLCMVAHAEGQHPAVVFRDYNIIQGRPSKTAEAMHRDFLLGGGKIEWIENSDTACAAVFSHPQGGRAEIRWDMERARLAGLLGRSRNKPNEPTMWEKYPRQMLRSRTVSEGCRTVWPAATGGFYETGEVIDIVDTDHGGPRQIVEAELTDEQRAENARAYATRVMAAVGSADSVEALQEIQAKARRNMRAMARTQPDIYRQVMKSYEAKTHQLQGFIEQDTASSGDPVEDFRVDLDQCETPGDVWELEKRWRAIRDAQSAEIREKVDLMFLDRHHDVQPGP